MVRRIEEEGTDEVSVGHSSAMTEGHQQIISEMVRV